MIYCLSASCSYAIGNRQMALVAVLFHGFVQMCLVDTIKVREFAVSLAQRAQWMSRKWGFLELCFINCRELELYEQKFELNVFNVCCCHF